MLNWIWMGLVLLAVALGGVSGQLPEITLAAFDAAKSSVMTFALPLVGLMAFWLGIMRIAEKSGLVDLLAKGLRPLLVRLFPDVPAHHPAMGSMVMNMAANMLGLNNAATPLGLRAMQDLEKLNPRPGTATNAMCTFLAINTSSIQLIPATTVAILASQGAKDPTAIIGTSFVATLFSTIAAIIIVKTLERLPMFALSPLPPPVSKEDVIVQDDVVRPAFLPNLGWKSKVLLSLTAVGFVGLFLVMTFMPSHFEAMANYIRQSLNIGKGPFTWPPDWYTKAAYERAISVISVLAIPFIVLMFPLYAFGRGVPVYEEFVEGAKEGFNVAIRIIPFMVAILAAVGMFRAAGGIDLIARVLATPMSWISFPPELLPMVLMRPLSGSGTTGLFTELVHTYGPDSFIARLGGTIVGSTETTFYVLAVYFGSVAIRKTRHAVASGLLADLVGVIMAVIVCYIAFR